MQISALIQVVNYLKDLSDNPEFLDNYKKLSDIVRKASEKPEEDFTAEIRKEKEVLQNFLIETNPGSWGYASYSLFEKINVNRLFGRQAADRIENLVNHGNKDYKAISAELTKTIKLIGKFSENLSKFRLLFDLIVPLDIFNETKEPAKTSTLYLYFEGRLSVQNITDLERYSRLWDGILDTFCKLTGSENTSLDISNFSNGNIVLGVATNEKTMSAIISGITGILSSLPLILKIRKIQYEISKLQFQNNLNGILEDEITILIANTAYSTAYELSEKYNPQEPGEEDLTNKLAVSLKQILSFVEKGGKIEYKPLTQVQETSYANKILIDSFSIVNELEKVCFDIISNAEIKE